MSASKSPTADYSGEEAEPRRRKEAIFFVVRVATYLTHSTLTFAPISDLIWKQAVSIPPEFLKHPSYARVSDRPPVINQCRVEPVIETIG